MAIKSTKRPVKSTKRPVRASTRATQWKATKTPTSTAGLSLNAPKIPSTATTATTTAVRFKKRKTPVPFDSVLSIEEKNAIEEKKRRIKTVNTAEGIMKIQN
jgi:hypothetical protein